MTMPRSLARAMSGAIDGVRNRVALAGAESVGPGVRLFGWPSVVTEGRLVIGRDVVFVSSPAPVELFVAQGAELVIGDGAVIESGATLRAGRSIVIGRQARIGVGCVIDDGAAEGIVIADASWLDDGVVLVGGARVPAGSVVARGTIVGQEIGALVPDAPPIADGAPSLTEVEARVLAVVGHIVPAAACAPRGADLRLYKGWDSLGALRILVALEREFAVTLPYDLLSREHAIEALAPYMVGVRGEGARRES
jgi:acetyltransferase-like isoleucine patch superfamily enzyme